MFVDRVFQLRLDVLQAVHHDLALLLRKVQGLVHLVGEERVARDVAPERGAAQQVGMEQQRPAFGRNLRLILHLHLDHLSRSHEYERSLLIVVVVTSVAQIAALHVLEENGVKSEAVAVMAGRNGFRLRKVDDAHQRMLRLHAARFVVLEDVVVFDHRAHMLK